MPVACFPAVGDSHGTRAAASESRRQVPFSILRRSWLEAPQNAFDPELTQTGIFSENCRVDCCPPGFLPLWYQSARFSRFPILAAACSCTLFVAWVLVARVNPALLCPSMLDTVFTSMPFCKARVAKVCPYGIITTNRKSPVFQGFSVIRQGFSSFSNPKNQAAK